MATTKIFVYENGKKLYVYPGVVVLGKTGIHPDSISILNYTTEAIAVDIPDGLVPNGQGGKITPVKETIPPGVGGGYHPHGNQKMAVAYKIKGVKTGRKGIGGSDPVIIIDT